MANVDNVDLRYRWPPRVVAALLRCALADALAYRSNRNRVLHCNVGVLPACRSCVGAAESEGKPLSFAHGCPQTFQSK